MFSNGISDDIRILLVFCVVGISLMDSMVVHPEIASVGKSLAALAASKRPFPHVDVALVGSQVPAAREALATLRTAKRSLPSVRAGVHRKLRRSEKALFTELTGVQADTGMAQEMPALMGGVGKALGTVRAGVRSARPCWSCRAAGGV